ncbi:uncharacterized protein METZ01_LOCUS505266, partial [marine metagenome]
LERTENYKITSKYISFSYQTPLYTQIYPSSHQTKNPTNVGLYA